MVRKLTRAVLGVVVLVVVLVGIVLGAIWMQQNRIAHRQVERGTAEALGVETHAGSVTLRIFAGNIRADDFRADNPEGYETQFLFRSNAIDTSVELMSLFGDVLRVRELEIDGLEIHIEDREGTTNIQTVNELMKGRPAEAPAEPGRQLHVRRAVIRDIVVHVHDRRLRGGEPVTVRVPELILEDVTPDSVRGVAVAELTQQLVPVVLAAVIEQGAGVIPEELLRGLSRDVAEMAERIGGEYLDLIEQAGGERVRGLLDEVAPEVREELDRAREGLEERVPGLFRRGEDAEE